MSQAGGVGQVDCDLKLQVRKETFNTGFFSRRYVTE